MEIITRRKRMASVTRKARREQDCTIGLVPTMGALHEGHLSLVREARRLCDLVVVSIFVNPTQFGPAEDFTRYPRDLTRDTALLTECNVDYIFAPAVEEIYPPGFTTYVNVEGVSERLEGASRPGHFRGVATVVTKLLNIARPDFAFFGQKDAQQTVVIRRLAADLALDTEIVVRPTLRDPDGLAMSSRNAYLTVEERAAAPVIYRALQKAETLYGQGERNAATLIETVGGMILREPLARLDYVAVTDAETLEPLDALDEERAALVSLAAHFGKTRLIDNVVLTPPRRTTGSLVMP
jgi:pantoate--beta-alanine ligase